MSISNRAAEMSPLFGRISGATCSAMFSVF
jgi:hypothetical protein